MRCCRFVLANAYEEFEKTFGRCRRKGGWLITRGWQTFAMHRLGQIGPTVNRMQRNRTNWPGNYQRSAGPMRAAPDPANWANGRLDQRSSAAMNDAASGRWGWRERVGGKIEHGGTPPPLYACWRWKALSGGRLSANSVDDARAGANPSSSPAAAVVGQWGNVWATRGRWRARAARGQHAVGQQQFSPLSQPRMD